MPFWISKPVYEFLPYFYLAAGTVLLGAAFWLDYGLWPAISLALGLVLLGAGVLLWWRRREFRARR